MIAGFRHLPLRLRATFLFGAGAFAGLGQAPYDLPWFTIFGFGFVLALQAQGAPARAALARGWAFGAGYFALTLHWIVQPFLVEPDVYGWMAPFALVFMAVGLGLFWGVAFALAQWLRPGGRGGVWALIVVWSAEEVFRSYAFTGFPWVLPGHIWIDTPFIHVAAVVGQHGLGLVTFGFAALVVPFFAGQVRWGNLVSAAIIASAVLLTTLPVLPRPSAPESPSDVVDARPLVRIVQPNAPQGQKYDPDLLPIFERRLMLATNADPKPALVVWPETAVPYLLEWSDDILAMASERAHGAPVVIGINRRDGERYYNSLVVTGLGGAVSALYDKEHLVPFGEYIPFGEFFARFGIQGLAASQGGGFSAGSGRSLIDFPGLGRARALICYEASFAEEIVPEGGERPDFLLIITNDAWFGSDAGPYQHLAHARLRAVEQGLPVIRAANTGVSAMIDAEGQLVASLALGQSGHFDAALPLPNAPTLYSRTGDWPMLIFLFAALSFLILNYLRVKQVDPDGRSA